MQPMAAQTLLFTLPRQSAPLAKRSQLTGATHNPFPIRGEPAERSSPAPTVVKDVADSDS
jgi:hypothetical protein